MQRADHDLDLWDDLDLDRPQRLRGQRRWRGFANQSRRRDRRHVRGERIWLLRQQRGRDRRAGRAKRNHVRQWLDRTLRFRRRVDHRCYRRFDRNSRRLGAGRASRHWRARDAERRERAEHQRRRRSRTLRLGRRRHRRDRADHDLDREHFHLNGPQRLRRQRGRRGIANQSCRNHGHDVVDERLWILRQQRRDDRRAGRPEHNHVRKWLDRPLRHWRRVDHHRRRRVDRQLTALRRQACRPTPAGS